jgi:CxxC motif-containing protein (DUF1111 family)
MLPFRCFSFAAAAVVTFITLVRRNSKLNLRRLCPQIAGLAGGIPFLGPVKNGGSAPTLTTDPNSRIAALAGKPANLFSDLAVHQMGKNLEDGISQGEALGNEFRTAPLGGLGQRLFFLHDGRTSDLVVAIEAHKGSKSEANGVIRQYNRLSNRDKQDLLNFLRSL